ncbi:MAG: histidinol-phosphatase [Bacteroidales bacterium]|nr:histidinol-phosphatase [Bacteroidales bacterium]
MDGMKGFTMHSNYHTHSRHCDGKGELRDYVEEALRLGFTHLGFSAHAPFPMENSFALPQEDFLPYVGEVRRLQAEYAGRINISLGLEADYIPGVTRGFAEWVQEGGLDYCIGSVHMVSGEGGLWFIDGGRHDRYDEGLRAVFWGDIRAGVRAFYRQTNEMLLQQHPDILGHFNKIEMHNRNRHFTPDEPWYRELVRETLSVIRECGCICEVNTRGIYKGRSSDFFPSRQILLAMKELRIPVMVATDAHAPEELSRDEGAYAFLQEIAYPEVVTVL